MNQENHVYLHIEKAIIEHRLAPGTRLRETKLSTIFDVKRGLIRKVLTRLTNAKLVQHTANIGAQVACPSLKEGQDLFATRVILERAVIEHCCKHIQPAELEALYHYLNQEEQAYQSGEMEKGKRLSADFHRQLVAITNNLVLIEYINDIINRTPLIMLSHSSSSNQEGCINQEHRQIVDAIAANDPTLATQIMQQHIDHLAKIFDHPKQTSPSDLSEALKL